MKGSPLVIPLCGRSKEFMFQPLTDGQVVETISCVGHEDSQHKDADSHENVRAEWGILMTIYPRHLHVDERIVGDIDGITDLAQELDQWSSHLTLGRADASIALLSLNR